MPTGSPRSTARIPQKKHWQAWKARTKDRRRSGHGDYNGQGPDNARRNATNQAREAKLKPCWENQCSYDPEIHTLHRSLATISSYVTVFLLAIACVTVLCFSVQNSYEISTSLLN